MRGDVIIACDFSSKIETLSFLDKFSQKGYKPYIKIGMELFYKEGPDFVREVVDKGYQVFLDLKLNDIPNTVHKAMKNIASLNVSMTNIHSLGGIEMMKAAYEGLLEGTTLSKKPELIAVTLLTSIDKNIQENELGIKGEIADNVKRLAENTKKAGLDGVVCSPWEAGLMKDLGLISVTPGIRFEGGNVGDQKRVATPTLAKEIGSTYIVVGRPITAAQDPVENYVKCLNDFLK